MQYFKQNILTCIFAVIFSMQFCFSQGGKSPAITISSDRDRDGNITFVSNNDDYCDYYVILDFPELRGYTARGAYPCKKNVRTGRENLLTLKKISDTSSPGYRWSYTFYRGSINAKPNLDYIYAMPVKSGDSTRVNFGRSGEFKLYFNYRHAGDTVYACRAGKVCNNDLRDGSSKTYTSREKIVIYHKDKTFSEYDRYTTPLVHAGDNVKVGQPIAIVQPDENGKKFVSFAVYYLDKDKMLADGRKHTSLIPIFHTVNNGDCKLDEKITYVAELTGELVTQDMNKKEKEKYEKKLLKQNK
ncbi:peptidoglycan DD-metalloendopeptidase family protein [Dysgonomonas sp. 520]|uniref:peptidoglycan DD-metalloendopeptidase family protein n=1 Tax=Dysgonomonas sp. 520 TaxID=2302931 RepID=UPI0013D790D2|nr:peptidoglycan DD-metalloendopeptidase family protein [Dysgonomonas sp. 520]NDW08499.1 hypothetical protein [Dysgonomonas sp. 520]